MGVDRTKLPALRADPVFTFPAIQKRVLSNGLNAWTVSHRSVPVVTAAMLLTVGSAADPPDLPGLASVTGDMLDEGAGDRSAIEVHDALARMGAQFDTEVGPDATILTIKTLARFRDRALALLADLVTRPRLDPHEFERVLQLRANRLRQLRDVPPALADRAFATLLYGAHPYGHLAIGTEEALERISREHVADFHRRAYRPSVATLVIAGDGSHDELQRAAEVACGAWSTPDDDAGVDASLSAALMPPAPPATRLALVHRPGAAQSELRVGHVAASRNTPDYPALLLLNVVLGGQFVSRINMNLREDKGFTYGARTSFDFRRGPGPFQLQVSVHTAATDAAIREALREIAEIRGVRPVTRDELELARAALTRGYPRNFETSEQIARSVTQLALYGLPDDYFEQFVPRLSVLDVDAVMDAAARYLDPSRLVTLVVGDRDQVLPAIGTLDLGPPALLEAV
jgi:zinc protease